MRPLRLTVGESMALAHVIHALELDPNLTERLERALIAPGIEQATSSHSLRPRAHTARSTRSSPKPSKTGFGAASCTERRQTPSHAAPYRPLAFEAFDDYAYLVAWNVEKDAERRYRLDRISDVKLTDDSIGRREPSDLTIETISPRRAPS